MRKHSLAWFLLALVFSGCQWINPQTLPTFKYGPDTHTPAPATTQPTTRPALTIPMLVRDPSLVLGVRLWLPEVMEQYGTNLAVIVGHGRTVDGVWAVFDESGVPSPVEWVVDIVRRDYPDRIIFLFVCNPDGIELKRTGVLYGKESLWVVPDSLSLQPAERDAETPAVIGRASELTFVPFVRPEPSCED